ncbi:MAG: amino acid adenylation domain-containing protein [Rhizobiaceae bacterium]
MSKLPDLDVYQSDVATRGLLEQGSPLVSIETIDRLAKLFPDLRRNDISFGLVAAYMARMSENAEATFPIQDRRTPLSHGRYIPVTVSLHPEESFGMFLCRALLSRTVANNNGESGWEYGATEPMSVAVSFGNQATPLAQAEVWLNCRDDGTIDWWHADEISSDAVFNMSERITALAEGICDDLAKPVSVQPLMSERERNVIVHEWNDTEKEYAYNGGLVAQMEQQAKENPDQVAVVFKDQEMTFKEFNARVNQLARFLQSKGVGRDEFVCLCLDRSFELVIALWATLKAGGAYVPLNTQDPVGRIAEIVEDCKPKVVLTQEHLLEQLEEVGADVVVLPEKGEFNPEGDTSNLNTHIAADSLAYMIYTSGSTGKPKGVIVEHGAIFNRVVWMHEEYGLTAQDRILQKTPYTFDVSVWEFLWSFSVGSTLVVAEPDGHMAIGYLYHLIKDQGVTHLHFVPSVLRLFMMAPALDQLPIKKLFCSGEALGFDVVQQFYDKANDFAEVHNLYGPTEAAVDVSYYHCPRNPDRNYIPIGKPVTNTSLHILDEFNQPVPVGVPGELYIGGVQLARGYWAREDLTEERFVANPVHDAPHERLYKTGDLARYMPDGEIVYMGRNDFQVKINGVRIELGEIEAGIRAQSGVEDVVVVAEENAGNKVLTAYVVADNPSEKRGEELKAGVGEICPIFYIPKNVVFIENMPLTVSGKVDRKVLASLPTI